MRIKETPIGNSPFFRNLASDENILNKSLFITPSLEFKSASDETILKQFFILLTTHAAGNKKKL